MSALLTTIQRQPLWALCVLLLFHVSGLIAMETPVAPFFIALTPLNMLVSWAILILYEGDIDGKFMTTMVGIMVGGFVLEVVGVNTGYPFGDYSYGSPFGIKWMDTPLLIGLNWFLMAYTGALVCSSVTKSQWLNALICGILIAGLDVVIEPVAIHLGFWQWASEDIPLQNYLTWMIATAVFTKWIYIRHPQRENEVAKYVLLVTALFFVAKLVLIW